MSLLYDPLLVVTMSEQDVLLLHATSMLCNDRVLTRDCLMADQSWCVVSETAFQQAAPVICSRGKLHIEFSNPCCCVRHCTLA